MGRDDIMDYSNDGSLDMDLCLWIGNSQLPVFTSADETRYCAFAAGFWGFHYFRASVENDLFIKNDSHQILMSMLQRLGLDNMFRGVIKVSKPHSLIMFKKTIIKRISLNIGDSLGTETQWMMLFGFNAAFLYSSLVGLFGRNNCMQTSSYLATLNVLMQDLVESAQKAKIDIAIIDKITQSQECLQHSNNMPLARNLYKIMQGLLITDYN